MNKILKTLIIILFIFQFNCSGFYIPFTTNLEIPEGPEEYQAGWYAGCRSGLSQSRFANSMIYEFDAGDGRYQDNANYKTGWISGYYICQISNATYSGMGANKLMTSPFD